MKLIALGLEPPGVRGIVSYTAMLRPGAFTPRQLLRWWLVPDYKSITASHDRKAFKFEGQRVKLVGVVDTLLKTGEIKKGKKPDPLTRKFATAFTKHYEKLAAVKPIYAELQNAFDAVITAAIIRSYDLDKGFEDSLAVFYKTGLYPFVEVSTPRQAESAINYKWLGNRLVMPVGGGVFIEPTRAVSDSMRETSPGKVPQKPSPRNGNDNADQIRWWWD